ncbi:hypothetical protein [Streptomyces sp. NPDC059455]|uniref:hypothetical protein n=1 Tax=Streptomyces sp. NPDC059455 TaxID=3346837 RepID=UPI0036BC3564
MSLTEQYALDLYRAAQRGEPAPPAPGRHDWRTLREYRDFRAVTAGRPARRRGRRSRLTDALRSVRAIREVFARRGSALRELPDLHELTDQGEERVGRGRHVVGRPLECG